MNFESGNSESSKIMWIGTKKISHITSKKSHYQKRESGLGANYFHQSVDKNSTLLSNGKLLNIKTLLHTIQKHFRVPSWSFILLFLSILRKLTVFCSHDLYDNDSRPYSDE